jgi:hypothetical protein
MNITQRFTHLTQLRLSTGPMRADLLERLNESCNSFEANEDGVIECLRSLEGRDEICIERRIQLFELFPFLTEHRPEGKSSRTTWRDVNEKRERLFTRIESGEPIYDSMMIFLTDIGCTNLKEVHLRRLAQMSVEKSYVIIALDDFAAKTPVDLFPSDVREANALKFYYTTLHVFTNTRRSANQSDEPSDAYFSQTMQSIYANHKLRHYPLIVEDQKSRDGLFDTLAFLNREVVRPFFFQNQQDQITATHKASDALLGFLADMSPLAINKLDRQIHSHWAARARFMRAYDKPETKPHVVQAWEGKYPAADETHLSELKGLKIVPLLTRAALIDEHEKLGGICIDAYAPACITGRSHCFSIRDQYGLSSSVFEVDRSGKLVQHESFGGDEPSKADREAAKAYIDGMENGRVKINPYYSRWLEKVRTFTPEQIYGYDPKDTTRAKILMGFLVNIPGIPKQFTNNMSYFRDRMELSDIQPKSTFGGFNLG